MSWTQELLEELQLLSLFPENSLQGGLKIHVMRLRHASKLPGACLPRGWLLRMMAVT